MAEDPKSKRPARPPRHFEGDVIASSLNIETIDEVRRRQKRTERITLGAALGFVLLIIALAVFTQGEVFTGTWNVIRSIETLAPRDHALNCTDPRNRDTRYCQERIGHFESDWRSVVRHSRGKGNAFSLHQPGGK